MSRTVALADTIDFDHYLRKLLHYRFKLIFRYFDAEPFLNGLNIDTFLRALTIFLVSVESPASRTLGLRVKHQSKKKTAVYFLLVVVLPSIHQLLDTWYKKKLREQPNEDTTEVEAIATVRQLRLAKQILEGLKRIVPAMQLFTLLRWWSGKGVAPTPSLCLAGISYEEHHPYVDLNVSYAHRRWTYEEFLQTFLMLSPFVSMQDVSSFFNLLTKPMRQMYDHVRSRKKNSCTLCDDEPIVVPYAADCGHLYCYSCLWNATNCKNGFRCRRCGRKVMSLKRVLVMNES